MEQGEQKGNTCFRVHGSGCSTTVRSRWRSSCGSECQPSKCYAEGMQQMKITRESDAISTTSKQDARVTESIALFVFCEYEIRAMDVYSKEEELIPPYSGIRRRVVQIESCILHSACCTLVGININCSIYLSLFRRTRRSTFSQRAYWNRNGRKWISLGVLRTGYTLWE